MRHCRDCASEAEDGSDYCEVHRLFNWFQEQTYRLSQNQPTEPYRDQHEIPFEVIVRRAPPLSVDLILATDK